MTVVLRAQCRKLFRRLTFLTSGEGTMSRRSGTRMDSQRTAGGVSPYSLGVSRQSPSVPVAAREDDDG